MNNEPIIVEHTYPAPVDKVWSALTDKEEMKQWYFNIENFEPSIGLDFNFLAGPPGQQYMHLCKIIELEPQRKITYSWRYDGYSGNSLVSFELTPIGGSTRVKLFHIGVETFPATNPDFAKEKFIEGWEQIMGKNLPTYLEKTSGIRN